MLSLFNNKSNKRFILNLSIIILFYCCCAFIVLAKQPLIELTLDAKKPTAVMLKTEQASYWLGLITSKHPILVEQVDHNNKVIKTFSDLTGQNELHLLIKEKDEKLRITSQIATKLELQWQHQFLYSATRQHNLEEPLLATIVAASTASNPSKKWQELWNKLKQQGVPLVTKLSSGQYRVTFIYQGAKENVRLLGSPSYNHDWLSQLRFPALSR